MFLFIHWNVHPEMLNMNGFPIRYYSLMFCLAFLAGIGILRKIYVQEGLHKDQLNHLVIYMAVGTLLGARLGDCLFYDWSYYRQHIAEIVLPFEIGPGHHLKFTGYQGLASHGGGVGILLAALLYCRRYKLNLLWLLDRLAIVCSIGGFFIRLGNLFNSEILGTPTNVPWAFIFERVDKIPRHPSQLYEAFCYFVIFLVLYRLYGTKRAEKGYLFSMFLVLVFLSRFIIEFWKQNQEIFEHAMLLDMGQLLSIPFILAGLYLQVKVRRRSLIK